MTIAYVCWAGEDGSDVLVCRTEEEAHTLGNGLVAVVPAVEVHCHAPFPIRGEPVRFSSRDLSHMALAKLLCLEAW